MNITKYNLDENLQGISFQLFFSSILNIIIATISLYLLIVLSSYLYKNKSKLNLCTSHQKNQFSTISKIILLVVIVMVLVRCLCYVSLFGFNKDFNTSTILNDEEKIYADAMCQVVRAIIALTLFIGTDLISLFLWIRQRIFYIHSEFKMFNNKCVRFISFASIIGMLLCELVLLPCYFIFADYRYDSLTSLCTDVVDLENIFWLQMITILFGAKTIVIELLLLGLFIFPLKKYETWRKNNNINGVNSNSSLNKTVKKVIFLSIIASISDIFVLLLVYFFNISYYMNTALFNLTMLINLFAAIGCFDDWKSILCPCKSS